MAEQFPRLSAATLAAANQVGAWLAQDDLAMLSALPQVDVVVLAGSGEPWPPSPASGRG